MRFRPCIDIHNGKVKQIVGGSLKDEGNQVSTNFTSELDAAWYARQYQKDHLKGGHIILKNPRVGSTATMTRRRKSRRWELWRHTRVECRSVVELQQIMHRNI